MSIIFLLTLAVIEKCTATDDGEKLYNFVKDYPASCDPSTMQRLMGENMIQTLVIPFQASPATGYLRLVKLGYVPTQGFGTSKVSIYNVKDDGQTYDFRFTYSMQGMKLTAEKAELLFNNQLTDVQFKGLFDYTEIHLSFKKTQINGRAQG
ncbi:hypothetical protein HDE_07641 [Halotydeus destructor]|nr:hypothetical protein HDE_07641 [Halotydeus destructor]